MYSSLENQYKILWMHHPLWLFPEVISAFEGKQYAHLLFPVQVFFCQLFAAVFGSMQCACVILILLRRDLRLHWNMRTIYLRDLPKCRCFTLLRWSSSLRKGKGSMQPQISLTTRGFDKVILHVVPRTNISPLCYLEMFFIPSYSMNPLFPHHLLVRKLIKRNFWSMFITATFLGAIGKAAAWWRFGVWFKKVFVNSIPAKWKHFSGIIIFKTIGQAEATYYQDIEHIASIFLWPPYLHRDRGPTSLASKSVVLILPEWSAIVKVVYKA